MKISQITLVNVISEIKHISRRQLFIVQKDHYIVMLSPKCHKDIIYINFGENTNDIWEYFLKDGKISVFPSIDYYGKHGRVHFYLIDSEVVWI